MTTPTQWSSEFLVNTITIGEQSAPAVTNLANGRFVVTWHDASGTLGDNSLTAIHGQVFKASGQKAGSEFLVNTRADDEQTLPAITALADGRFVATWSDFSSGAWNIRAQVFNVDGSKAATEFWSTAQRHSIRSLRPSRHSRTGVLSWHGRTAAAATRIFAPRSSIPTARSPAPSSAATATAGEETEPVITGLTDGRFVVAWRAASGNDGSGSAILAQIWNADGTKFGLDFRANTATPGDQYQPAMTALADGRFVIAWQDESQTGGDVSGLAVRAQVFNFDGTKSGPERLVNTTTLNGQSRPAIATLNDGRFVISFNDLSHSADEPSGIAIRTQVFNPDGSKSGVEFLTNTVTKVGDQAVPSIAVLADGRFVVAWDDSSMGPDDTSGRAVRARIFDPPRRGAPHRHGTDDDFIGTAFNDTLISGAGDRHPRWRGRRRRAGGRSGADYLDGHGGVDTRLCVVQRRRERQPLRRLRLSGGDAQGDVLADITSISPAALQPTS